MMSIAFANPLVSAQGRGWRAVLVGLAALAAAGIGAKTARADAPLACPVGAPCITELSVTKYGGIQARWKGTYDAFNIRWENPGLEVAEDVGDRHEHQLSHPTWGRTYRFSVQGCMRRTLQTSVCTRFTAGEITLRAPQGPLNLRLVSDNRLEWDIADPLITEFEVSYNPSPAKCDGDYCTRSVLGGRLDPTARSYTATDVAVLKDAYVCARNPAGQVCSNTVSGGNKIATKPVGRIDLAIGRISPQEDRTHFAGMSAIYEVVVNSRSLRPSGAVQVVLTGTGVAQLEAVTESDYLFHRFTCTGQGTITCTGTLGGSSDEAAKAVTVIRVRVRATDRGTGTISATVSSTDPRSDSNPGDNTRSLTITAK